MYSDIFSPCKKASYEYETREFGTEVASIYTSTGEFTPLCWSDGMAEVYITASCDYEDKAAVGITVMLDDNPPDYEELFYFENLTPMEALKVAGRLVNKITSAYERYGDLGLTGQDYIKLAEESGFVY